MKTIAILSLSVSAVCALAIVIDLVRHRQYMWIMNLVWPLTALYAGPLALLAYYKIGRQNMQMQGMQHPAGKTAHGMRGQHAHNPRPFWQSVVVAACHCGSGCTLGDLVSESLLLIIPVSLCGSTLYGSWAVDFGFAFAIGIIFQYYSIKPIRQLSAGNAWAAALKADALSLTFWQIGMYGWMAICVFIIFHHRLSAFDPVFWCMMQVAMLFGFVTAYPVNWWLLKKGIKEVM